MKLTTNFSSEELSATNTGIPNIPNDSILCSLKYVAVYLLQPIRNEWGKITVTSGYRSDEVNSAVGGIASSAHIKGRAVDIFPEDADIDVVFDWIVENSGIEYGSAILENVNGKRWIHISLPRLYKPNRMALIFHNGNYKPYKDSGLIDITA